MALPWAIGARILRQQNVENWESGTIRRLAEDLSAESPTMKGFSPSNLQYMGGFAVAWSERDSVRQKAVGNLPWAT